MLEARGRSVWVRAPSVGARRRSVAVTVAVVMALIVGWVGLVIGGFSPSTLFKAVFVEQFGSRFGLEDFGLIYAPIAFTALATAIALRAGLWNIGAEGQFYMGAVVTTGVGLFGPTGLAGAVLMFVGGMAGGSLWIAAPALARVYWRVDEIISTLLLNFVAVLCVTWLSAGPWRDRKTFVNAASGRIAFELPDVSGSLHIGIVIVVALAAALAVVSTRTRWGYEVMLCGANPDAAAYAGMPVKRRLVQVMLLSGAMAGLAGMIEVTGTVHRLQNGISSSYGYLGIISAVLVNGHPLGVLLSALLSATLLGAISILQAQGLSMSAVLALTGLVLFAAAIGTRLAEYRLIPRTLDVVPGRQGRPARHAAVRGS